jgi:hypothetical protein
MLFCFSIDEFDVFMDEMNRQLSAKMLVCFPLSKGGALIIKIDKCVNTDGYREVKSRQTIHSYHSTWSQLPHD